MGSGANRILQTMAKVSPDTISTLSYGTVQSIDPLVIVRESESGARTPLTAEFLILSKTCQSTPAWPALDIGERVVLLSFNGNQRFFVERT